MDYQRLIKINTESEFKKALFEQFNIFVQYKDRKNEASSIHKDTCLVQCSECGKEIWKSGANILYFGIDGCSNCRPYSGFNKYPQPQSLSELKEEMINYPWVEKRGMNLSSGQKWNGWDYEYQWECNQGHIFTKKPNDLRLGGSDGDCPICHLNNELSKLSDDVVSKVKNLSNHYEQHKLSIIDAFLISLQLDKTGTGAKFILKEATKGKGGTHLSDDQLEDIFDPDDDCDFSIKEIQYKIRLYASYIKDDTNVINGLYDTVGNNLWRALLYDYENRKQTISDLNKDKSPLIKLFLEEYKEVNNIKIPTCITKNISKVNEKSALCQKLIAYRLMKKHYYGNWAGTGVGKTISALLSMYITKSRLIVYVAVNSTVSQTIHTLKTCFGKEVNVFSNHRKGRYYDRKKLNVIVLNFEKFQNEYYHSKTSDLLNQHIDMIVIDEVQSVKSRSLEKEQNEKIQKVSQQRENLLFFQQEALKNNSLLYTLAMSATPVINEPNEVISILRFLGYETDISNSIKKGLSAKNLIHLVQSYNLVQAYGFRYKPELRSFIDFDYEEKNVHISGISLDAIYKLIEKPSILETENLLLEYKLNWLIKFIKKNKNDGFILYTHFVGIAEDEENSLINKIKEAVVQVVPEKQIRLFTSFDRNDHGFRSDHVKDFVSEKARVIIASRPISTGVDGLQERKTHVNLIKLILPWTSAEDDQILGRIVRQGSKSTGITVYNLLVEDYDMRKWNKLNFKRTVFDTIMEGKIPSSLEQECASTINNESVIALKDLAKRIENGEIQVQPKIEIIDANKDRKLVPRKKREVTNRFAKLKKVSVEVLQEWINKYPEEYKEYCEQREETCNSYPEKPREKIAEDINKRFGCNKILNIADIGCGYKAFLQDILNFHQVHSVDVTDKFDSRIIPGIAELVDQYFDFGSMDIVIFSLVMNWGSKVQKEQRIRSAHAILKKGGFVYCSEPRPQNGSRNKMTPENLSKMFCKNGFELIEHWERECYGKYYYLVFKAI